MNLKKLNAVMLLGGVIAMQAHAGMVQDGQGNVGYDTAAECDAAVQSGQARFYHPSTKMPALRRKGETSLRIIRLDEVDAQYAVGACDLGVNRKDGRNGVAKVLQGKYVPFSPAMPVHAYANKDGQIVRISMAKCDNRFSDVMPRPVPAPVAAAPAPAPVAVAPAPAPVAVAPAPVAAPVVAAPAPVFGPYVFGTVGALRDLVGNETVGGIRQHDDHDTRPALQLGVGYQFNSLWGAEAFAQGGSRLKYENGTEHSARALGARGTVGYDMSESARMFAKLGVARVTHTGDAPSQSQTRPTVGLGMLFKLNDNLAVRADFDHYIKKNGGKPQFKAMNYVGVGVQYSFMP